MIDLHLHLDGSLSKEELIRLASISKIDPKDVLSSRLSVDASCTSLNDYLECFEGPLKVLQSKEAIKEAVRLLLIRLGRQGLRYAEIRFAPQLSTSKGLTQEEVVLAAIEGLFEGKRESGIEANLILCMMRGEKNHRENEETVRLASKFLGRGVVAVDLAGAEGLFKTETFAAEFALARSLSVPFTIHAGEADGAKSVKDAIAFGASRIGHGVRAVEDPEVVALLAEKNIPLEICPTSEVDTHCVSSISALPLRELLSSRVPLTINTDDMTVSNVTLNHELETVKETFGFDEKTMRRFLESSIEASFASPEIKARLRKELL